MRLIASSGLSLPQTTSRSKSDTGTCVGMHLSFAEARRESEFAPDERRSQVETSSELQCEHSHKHWLIEVMIVKLPSYSRDIFQSAQVICHLGTHSVLVAIRETRAWALASGSVSLPQQTSSREPDFVRGSINDDGISFPCATVTIVTSTKPRETSLGSLSPYPLEALSNVPKP